MMDNWFKKKVDETPETESVHIFKVTQKKYDYGYSYDQLVAYYPSAEAAFDAKISSAQVSKIRVIKVDGKLYEWYGSKMQEVKVAE